MPEGRGGPPPSNRGEPNKEGEQSAYYQAARFPGEWLAGQAYFMAQETIYQDEQCELSAFRVQLNHKWYVAVVGEQPSNETDEALADILSEGEIVPLPPRVLKLLVERRERTKQPGRWVEGHHRPGVRLDEEK
jgi:hypothetical protein